MKKSSRNVKINESVKGIIKNKGTSGARTQPLTGQPLHPWYYVKGRPDLTEKNISSRREREDQKYRQSVSDNQYFAKQLAETQVFDKWVDNKSLVKHGKQNYSLKPPFDVLSEPKIPEKLSFRSNKGLENKYLKGKEKLKQFLLKFHELNEKYKGFESKQKIVVLKLKNLMAIITSIEDKKELFRLKNKRLLSLRLSRDKLREKVFEIESQLKFYKKCVESIHNFKDVRHVLNDEEMTQLSEVMERAIKIIDLFIDINNNRNNEFLRFYDEEADDRWEEQEEEWVAEYDIWNSMTEKLMDSYKNILKDKLSELLTQMNTSIEEREQLMKELTTFTVQIKSNPQLSVLLTENIDDFMTELIQN